MYKVYWHLGAKITEFHCRGGTEGGAGGAIAPPLFPEAGHSPTTRFNECGKRSSGAITRYVVGTTSPGSDLFTNSH